MAHKIKMPQTETPGGVLFMNLAIIGGSLSLMFIFLGIWGIGLFFLILAFTIDLFFRDVPGFHAIIMINKFTGGQRALFQGQWNNPVLPWEAPQGDLIDLRSEFHEVISETWATAGTVLVGRYIYAMRINIDHNPSQNVILYSSFEPDAIKQTGRGIFSQLISDYFRTKKVRNLPSKQEVTHKLFGGHTPAHASPDVIQNFEEEHGVLVHVLIEDIDFDAQVQKFRGMITGADSMQEAIRILTADGKINDEEAVRILKLANFEGFNQTEFKITAEGLENLTSVVMPGGAGAFSGKKKK